MTTMLAPPPSLLSKLASIVVHADELTSEHGHQFDQVALQSAIHDPEVKTWIEQMTAAAMAPRKRNP
jgi:hypothetical protein